jgi:hypothetical protein
MSSQSAYDAACKRALLARERFESLEDIHSPEYAEAYIQFRTAERDVKEWEEHRIACIKRYEYEVSEANKAMEESIRVETTDPIEYHRLSNEFIGWLDSSDMTRADYKEEFGIDITSTAYATVETSKNQEHLNVVQLGYSNEGH